MCRVASARMELLEVGACSAHSPNDRPAPGSFLPRMGLSTPVTVPADDFHQHVKGVENYSNITQFIIHRQVSVGISASVTARLHACAAASRPLGIGKHEMACMQGFASYLFGTFLGYQRGEQEVVEVSPIAANDYDYEYTYAPFPSSGKFEYSYASPGPVESALAPAPASARAAMPAPGPSAHHTSPHLRGHNDYSAASSDPGGYGAPADYTADYTAGYAPVPASPGDYTADYAAYAYTPSVYPPGSSLFAGLDLEEILAYYDAPAPAQYADTAYAPDGYGPTAGGTGADSQDASGVERLSAAEVAAHTPEAGVITPNVLREARRHFGCPTLERVLLEDGFLSEPSSHWSLRLYEVRHASHHACLSSPESLRHAAACPVDGQGGPQGSRGGKS